MSAKKEYKVGDLIIDDEYGTIDSTASVVEAAQKIKELKVPDLVVVDDKSKNVLGVIADYDIVQNVVAEGKDPKNTLVTDAMYIITPVSRETPVKECFKVMQEMNVNVVPVIEEDKLLGVASIQDCWSYIPDENPDDIGLISVANPKTMEFYVASMVTLLAFIFGILMPAIGVYGFFNETGNIPSMGEFVPREGAIWVSVLICNYAVLILGVLTLFSIFYGGISDMRNFYVSNVIKILIPYITIGLMILQWILYAMAFRTTAGASVDGVGLFFSILSMLLLLLAINRDIMFKTQGKPSAEQEVAS
ncbi:cyclic nucleotide-binding/CBS domain-containing protein [Promethearchaeum syntrophicum]|uniref:Cyclic nucleotide-binding/CBS domain-containing protein n=1 Tax=Promethearchaeum syntrophicum TaxID=2594042 RepID=A0A5B9D984_9ARCH|nr:CBS domain-containing protein [Candidatus Prometheoarchaeum syntrophicum]QEE15545.1 CBS domain protein [Candidatus Prometheoarchaeum syntrophicum]